jgi:hypothetical protein
MDIAPADGGDASRVGKKLHKYIVLISRVPLLPIAHSFAVDPTTYAGYRPVNNAAQTTNHAGVGSSQRFILKANAPVEVSNEQFDKASRRHCDYGCRKRHQAPIQTSQSAE